MGISSIEEKILLKRYNVERVENSCFQPVRVHRHVTVMWLYLDLLVRLERVLGASYGVVERYFYSPFATSGH